MTWLDWLIDRWRYLKPKPTPAPPKPKPTPAPPAELDLVGALNAVRAGHGVPPVAYHMAAYQAAALQARWQAARDRIGHDGPPGLETLADRLATFASPDLRSGEICAQGEIAYWPDGRLAIAYDFGVACRDWLTSPGHRRILLDPAFTHAGAATATAVSGRIYCVAVFFNV